MYYIYNWDNLAENSPQPFVRNEWLWNYGAFCRYKGLWFPCKVVRYNTIGEPAYIIAIPAATENMEIYPKGQISTTDLDVLYTIFPDGLSLETYIYKALKRRATTMGILDGAIVRSLNTEIISAPTNLIQQIKNTLNKGKKGDIRVVDNSISDSINVIEIPQTSKMLEDLWNSADWSMQEIMMELGIQYNPSQGKKERMIKSEMLGDFDLCFMNREKLTSMLRNSAKKFGEKVEHISSMLDANIRDIYSASEGIASGGENDDVI